MSVSEQQKTADYLLTILEAIDPYCIVAGGAPRDWYFGKEAADIDIFLHIPENRSRKATLRQFDALGLVVDSEKSGENIPDFYKLNPSLIRVLNIGGLSTPVQVMVMREPTHTSVVPNFPLSISKIWYKNGVIATTRDFDISVRHKAIFKCSELYANGHSYVGKIVSKFPDFKYYESVDDLAYGLL